MKRAALLVVMLLAGCDSGESLQRMSRQPRTEAFGEEPFFADGAAMQTPPEGTVPWGSVAKDAPDRLDGIPVPVTRELLERGRKRFAIYCAACHGLLGDGHTVVGARMKLRPPPSLHERRDLPPGRVEEVIARGYGLMPSYASQLSTEDRWAVAAYVGALRLSQAVALDDLPPAVRAEALAALRGSEGGR